MHSELLVDSLAIYSSEKAFESQKEMTLGLGHASELWLLWKKIGLLILNF